MWDFIFVNIWYKFIMARVFRFRKNLYNKLDDYRYLIDFYNEWKHYKNEELIIDLKNTTFIAANLVAFLGAIFDELCDVNYFNSITLRNIAPNVKEILQKNDFLSHFGVEKIDDTFKTTVEYRKIRASNESEFTQYLASNLFTANRFPDLPMSLRKVLVSSFVEIFINAGMHGDCEHVYTCGQYFPNEHKLDFSIVNLGTTIKENVQDYFVKRPSEKSVKYADEAIDWAVEYGHTTKNGVTGGLGLYRTIDFIKKNKGTCCIISDDGCWFLNSCGNIETQRFPQGFNGTLVNFEINMNDTYNYDI